MAKPRPQVTLGALLLSGIVWGGGLWAIDELFFSGETSAGVWFGFSIGFSLVLYVWNVITAKAKKK